MTWYFVFIADPRVNDWPLMDSPFPTLLMVITYLYIVTYLGPKVMANRKPFKLNNVLVYYNAGQVIFSLGMLWEVSVVVAVAVLQKSKTPQLSNIIPDIEFETKLSSIILNCCAIKTSFSNKEWESVGYTAARIDKMPPSVSGSKSSSYFQDIKKYYRCE